MGAVAKKSTNIAFWLTAIPGLLIGMPSLGYLYLGKTNRGYFFLGFSVALWYLLVVYFLGPWNLSAFVGLGIAVLWSVGSVAGIYDIRNQIRKAEKKQVVSNIEHVIRP